MGLRLFTTGADWALEEYQGGFYMFPPGCFYCASSARPGKLTCESHRHCEGQALLATQQLGPRSRLDARQLPQCANCDSPHLGHCTRLNLCERCLLEMLAPDSMPPVADSA
jgi:hypothetical protein